MNCTNARINASVLSMYDIYRLQGPKVEGQNISWNDFNLSVKSQLESFQVKTKSGFAHPILCKSNYRKIISEFIQKYPNVQHVIYDSYLIVQL
ncbi:MAG: hypothetical protein CM15mP102_01800 [Flavobacteriales bacterium]|nr:MAG: hypothetical protein CM15mP102_01800 [Flavobacteriales bacterium]